MNTIKKNKKQKQVFELGFYVYLLLYCLPACRTETPTAPFYSFSVRRQRHKRTSIHVQVHHCAFEASIAFSTTICWFFSGDFRRRW